LMICELVRRMELFNRVLDNSRYWLHGPVQL